MYEYKDTLTKAPFLSVGVYAKKKQFLYVTGESNGKLVRRPYSIPRIIIPFPTSMQDTSPFAFNCVFKGVAPLTQKRSNNYLSK